MAKKTYEFVIEGDTVSVAEVGYEATFVNKKTTQRQFATYLRDNGYRPKRGFFSFDCKWTIFSPVVDEVELSVKSRKRIAKDMEAEVNEISQKREVDGGLTLVEMEDTEVDG